MPRVGPRPLVASGLLAAADGAAWLAQVGPHAGYGAGVLGPMILAGAGLGMVIAPAINTGTFGVAPQDAGAASATVTVGQQLGASIGTSLLNTIFAGAVTAYLTVHLAAARLISRQALTGLALSHGYDTAFWWVAGIFAGGAVVGGALLRPGPLGHKHTPSPAPGGVTTAQAHGGLPVPRNPQSPKVLRVSTAITRSRRWGFTCQTSIISSVLLLTRKPMSGKVEQGDYFGSHGGHHRHRQHRRHSRGGLRGRRSGLPAGRPRPGDRPEDRVRPRRPRRSGERGRGGRPGRSARARRTPTVRPPGRTCCAPTCPRRASGWRGCSPGSGRTSPRCSACSR